MSSKILKSKRGIISWLKNARIKNYILIKDDSFGYIVDVNGGFNPCVGHSS
jgi:hypothetical protein